MPGGRRPEKSMHRASALIVFTLLAAPRAYGDHGAMMGIRAVSLEGDIVDSNRLAFAVSGILTYELPRGFAVGFEPGIRSSGSHTFRMVDLVGGLAGRYTHAIEPEHHLRVTLALAPAYRIASDRRFITDDGIEWEHVTGIRGWDLDAVAGLGYELAVHGQRYFVDLRYARSLTSVDVRAMPLVIYRRELGIWFGVMR
jgi:hypothetical protein